MSSLLVWLFLHAELVLALNLAAGCYAALWFAPELGIGKLLRSPIVRVTIVAALMVLGVPLLIALIFGHLLERRRRDYPLAGRSR